MHAVRYAGGAGDDVGAIAAGQANGVAEDCVARAGVLLKRSDKEQVGRWTERGEDKWTAGDNREQCQEAMVRKPLMKM